MHLLLVCRAAMLLVLLPLRLRPHGTRKVKLSSMAALHVPHARVGQLLVALHRCFARMPVQGCDAA